MANLDNLARQIQLRDSVEKKWSKYSHLLSDAARDTYLYFGLTANDRDEGIVLLCNVTADKCKYLNVEELQVLDATLSSLDKMHSQFQQTQRIYEEAKRAMAEKIRNLAT